MPGANRRLWSVASSLLLLGTTDESFAACPTPQLQHLLAEPAVRAGLLSHEPRSLELNLFGPWPPGVGSAARSAAGHWAHLGGTGPHHGLLVWVPCGSGIGARAGGAPRVRTFASGGFVHAEAQPAKDHVPARLLITTRSGGTGIEQHRTAWVAWVQDQPRQVWHGTTYEHFAGVTMQVSETSVKWSADGRRATLTTQTRIDNRTTSLTEHRLCWWPARLRYAGCGRHRRTP